MGDIGLWLPPNSWSSAEKAHLQESVLLLQNNSLKQAQQFFSWALQGQGLTWAWALSDIFWVFEFREQIFSGTEHMSGAFTLQLSGVVKLPSISVESDVTDTCSWSTKRPYCASAQIGSAP